MTATSTTTAAQPNDTQIDAVIARRRWGTLNRVGWFLADLGLDWTFRDDAWSDQLRQYCSVIQRIMERVLVLDEPHDLSRDAYRLYLHTQCDPAWVQSIVERVTRGDPARVAFLLCCDDGVDPAWAEQVIERAADRGIGDPRDAAYRMAERCGSDPRWAESIH